MVGNESHDESDSTLGEGFEGGFVISLFIVGDFSCTFYIVGFSLVVVSQAEHLPSHY